MQEEVKIEVMSDPTSATKNKLASAPRIKSQQGKTEHPNSRYSIT